MPKTVREYEPAKVFMLYMIEIGVLPFKIVVRSTKLLHDALGNVLRKNNLNDDIGISADPDKDGFWIYRKK